MPSGCSCKAGYAGSVSANTASPFYRSSCSGVLCPANLNGDHVPNGCSWNAGYAGSISAIITRRFYNSSCSAVVCPANSNGDHVPSGCSCKAGYAGSVSAGEGSTENADEEAEISGWRGPVRACSSEHARMAMVSRGNFKKNNIQSRIRSHSPSDLKSAAVPNFEKKKRIKPEVRLGRLGNRLCERFVAGPIVLNQMTGKTLRPGPIVLNQMTGKTPRLHYLSSMAADLERLLVPWAAARRRMQWPFGGTG